MKLPVLNNFKKWLNLISGMVWHCKYYVLDMPWCMACWHHFTHQVKKNYINACTHAINMHWYNLPRVFPHGVQITFWAWCQIRTQASSYAVMQGMQNVHRLFFENQNQFWMWGQTRTQGSSILNTNVIKLKNMCQMLNKIVLLYALQCFCTLLQVYINMIVGWWEDSGWYNANHQCNDKGQGWSCLSFSSTCIPMPPTWYHCHY